MATVAEDLTQLIMFCMGSAQLRELVIEQEAGPKVLRAQMHLFIHAPPGHGKSTILHEIREKWKCPLYSDVSRAALAGSIENGQAIVPAVWEAKNSLLLLDEYGSNSKDSGLDALNQLTENQYAKRKVARRCEPVDKSDKSGCFWKVNHGVIEVRTRFSAILATMKLFNHIPIESRKPLEALVSRCVYYPYKLTDKDLDRMMMGHKLLNMPKEFNEKSVTPKVHVSLEDYKKILECVCAYPSYNKQKNHARTVGDCVRVFAVNKCKHDERAYTLITHLHQDEDIYAVGW